MSTAVRLAPVARALPLPVAPAASRGWPLWLRLTAAIAVALVVAWSALITLAHLQRREGTIAQAHDFAQSVAQLATATITGLMITKTYDRRDVYLDQMRNATNIRGLRVLRHGTTLEQYGPSSGPEAELAAEEVQAMREGRALYRVLPGEREELLAVIPILNASNYLGKSCMKCHEGAEDAVLGAISLRVDLDKARADLRAFTWGLAGLAVALSLPLLGAIFLLVRRYVVRPLGGEPSEVSGIAARIAAGDLGGEVAPVADARHDVLADMGRMQRRLRELIGQIDRSAAIITRRVEEVGDGSRDLAARTEEQAASLEETASALEELTAAVGRNAASAARASELVTGAAQVARQGGERIGGVVASMDAIHASSRKMTEIVGVIDAIAFQTNLLAVNAAVEAARAGESGRGFAVVAQEVRMLAQRSAAAAKQVGTLIAESTRQVESGTRQVDEAGGTMARIVEAVEAVAALMAQIAGASAEQRRGIEEVNRAVAQMDQVTQSNAALVEQTATALEGLGHQARELDTAVGVFRRA